jgi:hypothetical protein
MRGITKVGWTATQNGRCYPEFPISSCLDPGNAPRSTGVMVGSPTNAVNTTEAALGYTRNTSESVCERAKEHR